MKKFIFVLVPILVFFSMMTQSSKAEISVGERVNTLNTGNGVQNGVDSNTTSNAVQSDGKIIVVGSFNFQGNNSRNSIARLNADLSNDSTFLPGTGANGRIRTVGLQSDGKIIIAGEFTSYNGTSINRIARLNSDGTLDSNFNNLGTAANGTINEIKVLANDTILIMGDFNSFNGNTANRIALLNSNGSLNNAFSTNIGTGANSTVLDSVVQSDNKIILVGVFTQFAGNTVNRIVRINSDGTYDNTFVMGTGANDAINSVGVLSDGRIIIAGNFTTYNGNSAAKVARLTNSGAFDSSFSAGTGPNLEVIKLAVDTDNSIIIAGMFTTYDGNNANMLARLDSNGVFLQSLNSESYSMTNYYFGNLTSTLYTSWVGIRDITIKGNGNIVVSGLFYTFGNEIRNNVAEITSNGTMVSAVINNYGASNQVRSLFQQADDKILISGYFGGYNGVVMRGLARITSSGNLDNSFVIGEGFNGLVADVLENSNGQIYVTGNFNKYDNQSVGNLIRLNSNGTLDNTFNVGTGFNSTVSEIEVFSDGRILVAGGFTQYNGNAVNRVACLNPDGSLCSGYDIGAGFNNYVYGVATLSGDKALVFGAFTNFQGTGRNYIVMLNSDGTLDTSFNNGGVGPNNFVLNAIPLSGGEFLLAGMFTTYNLNNVNRLVKLNSNGNYDNTFNIGTGFNSITSIIYEQPNNKYLVGGSFTTYDGNAANRIIRLNPDGSKDNTFTIGIGLNFNVFNFISLRNSELLIGGAFSEYNGEATNYLVNITNENLYQIDHTNVEYDFLQQNTGNSYRIGSFYGATNSEIPITVQESGIPVADVNVYFNGSGDRDWSNVTVNIDLLTGKSVLENLNPLDAPGASATHSLYVPKLTGQDSVYVCPDATDLASVYLGCPGGYALASGTPSLSIENISGQEYWVVDGLTGTGALGLSQYGTPFTITPNSDEVNSTQEVVLSYGTTTGFAALDKVQFIFETTAGFTLANTCGTPTTDANGDSTADGSASIVGGNVYEYTFNNTVTGPATVSFCVNVTSPATAGSYSVSLTDDNGSFGSAMYYVGDDNDVFVIANVMPSLSFNIRTLADDADTNVCNFGTVSSSTPIPDYNDQADIASECGYSLAVGTNAVGGFQTQIVADGPLNGAGGSIADLSNGGSFSAGVEAYGFASITPSTSGRNPLGGLYTESILRSGNFDLAANTGTSIPTTIQTMLTYNNGVQYTAGVDNVDVTRVVHGIVIGSGTPAGYYDQVITYTTTANF